MTPYASTDRIRNTSTLQRVGGVAQTVTDTVSTGKTWGQIGNPPRSDLIVESDDTVMSVARQIVAAQSEDFLGVQAVMLDIDMAPLALPLVLALYASQGLTGQTPLILQWTHPAGDVLTLALVIDGMTHNIAAVDGGTGAQLAWTAQLLTSKLAPQAKPAVWDVSYWDQDEWAFAVPVPPTATIWDFNFWDDGTFWG